MLLYARFSERKEDMFKAIRKFVIASVGLLLVVGVIDNEAADAIVAATTALLTYLVPNA